MRGNQRSKIANLECFDSHSEVVFLPYADIHLSILASSQLMLHGDVCALHLPLIVNWRHTIHCRLVTFGCWVVQCGDQAICYSGVMVNQLSQCCKTAFRCHIHLKQKYMKSFTTE